MYQKARSIQVNGLLTEVRSPFALRHPSFKMRWESIAPLTFYHHWFFFATSVFSQSTTNFFSEPCTFPMVFFSFNALPPIHFQWGKLQPPLVRYHCTFRVCFEYKKKGSSYCIIIAEQFRWEQNMLLSMWYMCIFWRVKTMPILPSGTS